MTWALIWVVGADILFAPPLAEMYPEEPRVTVQVSGLTEDMEGAHRPGHFTGVATVVTKLFAGLRPDLAFFGRKDAQQLAVVRRLARDSPPSPWRWSGARRCARPTGSPCPAATAISTCMTGKKLSG